MWPWSYVTKYTYEHPETVVVDRKGNYYWMIREYAYPGERSSKVDEFVYMAKHDGLKRFIACMRSEASQVQPATDKADRYGFNAPVVHDMRALFGVDILTDPRFDVDSPKFDPCDPMVQNWHNLRGTYVTQLYRELRERLREVDPNIKIAITLSGDYTGPVIGNIRLDWRTWIDEGLIDEIIAPVTFEATYDLESDSKGYLTNVRSGKGTVPFSVLREYIDHSKHPEIKLISSGGPVYFFTPPPEGTDGWRCAAWYDEYHLAWSQRWQQWKKDLKDFGDIKFFEQNFDKFPINDRGAAGGRGDMFYRASTRTCEGCWYKLGDGNDAKPVVQNIMKHGDKGNAIKLTRTDDGRTSLTALHNGAPDRSKFSGCLDNAITNGNCTFEFWLYRDNDASSVSVYFQGDAGENDVGLFVAAGTGKLSYSDKGKWVECDYALPVKKWQKFTIKIDLDNKNYSAYTGTDNPVQLCGKITYAEPKPRFTSLHGVDIPISVPAYKIFNRLAFVPQGKVGNVMYLDDVMVKWVPTMHYIEPGTNVYLADDFETHPVDAAMNALKAPVGGVWKSSSAAPADSFYVHNGTSFGEGVRCMRSKGGSDITIGEADKLKLDADNIVTLDFDIFIRSNKDYPYIIPDPTTRSNHRTAICLEKASDSKVIGIYAGDGTWQYWNGDKYVDSGIGIAYDVWNHVQLALDTSAGSYSIVVQPVGEMPTFAAKGNWAKDTKVGDEVYLRISPSNTAEHISCYDNIAIAYGQKKK